MMAGFGIGGVVLGMTAFRREKHSREGENPDAEIDGFDALLVVKLLCNKRTP